MRPILVSLLFFATTASAAPPPLDALFPAGGQAGSEISVKAEGKFADWPVKIWCSSSEIEWSAGEKKGELTAKIAKNAPIGPVLVRFFNDEGASAAKTFVIGNGAEILEADANETLKTAQKIDKLPILINGRFEKGDDIDHYRVTLKKGQTLTARMVCYALGSLSDPFLHLLDSRNFELTLASVGRNLDPVLVHTAPADGDFWLRTQALDHIPSTSVAFTGSASEVYRLELSLNDPPEPNFPEPTVREDNFADPFQRIEPPFALRGNLSEKREIDRFEIPAEKGQKWFLDLLAHRRGSALDPVMRVIRPDGRDFKMVDDVKPHRDAELLLTAPLAGDYTVEIWDRFNRGGPDFNYQLEVAEPEVTFTAVPDKEVYSVEAGKTAEVKLKLTRLNGHAAKLAVEIPDLPEGVSFDPPEVPEKSGDIKIELKAAETAALANLPLQIKVSELEVESAKTQFASFSYQGTTARGPYLIDETEWLWLTVVPKPEEKPKDDEKAEKDATE